MSDRLRDRESKLNAAKHELLRRLSDSQVVGRDIDTIPDIEILADNVITEGSEHWGWAVDTFDLVPRHERDKHTGRVVYVLTLGNAKPSELEPEEFLVVVKNRVIEKISTNSPVY